MKQHKRRCYTAQAAVECAFLIPVVLLLFMLLIQPSILLYNYMVMKGAASEGCRLLATRAETSASQNVYEGSICRHLGAVPQQENFHVHQTGCSWIISLEGNEYDSQVKVTIENQVKPLPFFDFAAGVLGLTNGAGNFVQKVEVQREIKAPWVQASEDGIDPNSWVHRDDSLVEGG